MSIIIWNSVAAKSTDPIVAGNAQTDTFTKDRVLERLHF